MLGRIQSGLQADTFFEGVAGQVAEHGVDRISFSQGVIRFLGQNAGLSGFPFKDT